MRCSLCLCASLILLPGCGERAPDADAPADEPTVSADIFAGLPVMPGSRFAGGSADAAEAVVEVAVAPDSVARFYRRVLTDRSWDIRGDATAPDGQVTLHARSPEGRPIWIMIRPIAANRSEVSLIATAVDTTAPRP
jgi:hypothetical protein